MGFNNSIFSVCLVLLISSIISTEASPSHRVKRKAPAPCTQAIQLQPGKTHKINADAGKRGRVCDWTFLGTEKCYPKLQCSNIKLKDDCDDEHIIISDGYQGEQKLCGKAELKKSVSAAGKARDIFVRFKKSDSGTAEFSCEASCGPPEKSDSQQLPEVFKRKEASCVCGLQNEEDRIVGGEDSKLNEFPWQAALVYTGTREPKCGATVLNEKHILTATHCFYFDGSTAGDVEVLLHAFILDMTKKDIAKDVALGELGSIRGSGWNFRKVSDDEEKTKRYKVAEIIMHPLFTEQYDYDFALLRLESRIELESSDSPTPICLPPANNWGLTFEGTNPWVVGWGMPDENAGGTTRFLQKLSVPIIPQKKCSEWMPDLVTQRMICAGFEKGVKDACTGDSGGPLILKQENKQWWQIGIVSWGEGCAEFHKPGMYSRVTEMHAWISFHANQHDAKWCRDTK